MSRAGTEKSVPADGTADEAGRLPVTLLTGFLGAGKTTLVNRLLTERSRERIAVLVNEFGDVPVDGRLVVRSEEEVVELANGCVCCSIRGDLVAALGRVLRRPGLDRILIETSGLASPGPVLQTLLVEPGLAARTLPAGVVTLVHGALILEQLEEHPEAGDQVGYADLLVVNHADRCDEARLERVEATLARLQPGAARLRTTRAELDVARVLEGLAVSGPEVAPSVSPLPDGAGHVHAQGAGAVTLRSRAPLDLDTLKIWLQFLTTRRSHELWRIKGILRCAGRPDPVVVQSVYQFLELGPGEGEPPEESVLVVIGRDLDAAELERGWEAARR